MPQSGQSLFQRLPLGTQCRRRCWWGSAGVGADVTNPNRIARSVIKSSALASALAQVARNKMKDECVLVFLFFFEFFLMRLYRALRGCSCGSREFRRGPDDGHNHRQGATSSTSRVTSIQGQSRTRTAWAIPVRNPRAGTAPLLTVDMARWLQS